MAQERPASLGSLPAEVLYRVLDNLSCEEIFFSYGHVCRQFRLITQTYHRYKIDLSWISKPRFDLICRLIRPENVLSLTLSNNDETAGQITLFLSLLDIGKFTRLRHLTLTELSHSDREKLERGLKSCPLVSLTIQSQSQLVNLMGMWLTSLVEETQLSQLTLRTHRSLLNRIRWQRGCSLTSLHIDECQPEDYLLIVGQLPSLQTLVVDNYRQRFDDDLPSTTHRCRGAYANIFQGERPTFSCGTPRSSKNIFASQNCFPDPPLQDFFVSMREPGPRRPPPCVAHCRSLKSLTITMSDCWMNQIESVLSLTPSLRHLKLYTWYCKDHSILKGKKWEEFVQLKLCDLETFQFFFVVDCYVRTKVEELIESFRSPFWLEEKRWFVCAETIEVLPSRVYLFTIPRCNGRHYNSKVKERVFAVTPSSPETRMEQIRTLDITTAKLRELGNKEKDAKNDGIRFPRVTNLRLNVNSHQSIQHLSTLIDLKRLKRISLRLDSHLGHDEGLLRQLTLIFQNASNVHSMDISRTYGFFSGDLTLGELAGQIPLNVRHIQVELATAEEMKVMVEKVPHLYSLTFRWRRGYHETMFVEFYQWLKGRGIDHLSEEINEKVHLWFGERSNQSGGSRESGEEEMSVKE